MRRRRLALPAGLVLLALLAGACGVPISRGPTLLKAQVPSVLGQPEPAQSQCVQPNAKFEKIYIWLVRAGLGPEGLAKVDRCVPKPVTAEDVLKYLEVGPYVNEEADGYVSDLNLNSSLAAIGGVTKCPPPLQHDPHCGLATVRLDRYYEQLQGEAPIEELGQIVLSLADSGIGVSEVRFVGPNGSPIGVETGAGEFVKPGQPVTAEDYKLLTAAI